MLGWSSRPRLQHHSGGTARSKNPVVILRGSFYVHCATVPRVNPILGAATHAYTCPTCQEALSGPKWINRDLITDQDIEEYYQLLCPVGKMLSDEVVKVFDRAYSAAVN